MFPCPECNHRQPDHRDECSWCGADLVPYQPRGPSLAVALCGTLASALLITSMGWVWITSGPQPRWVYKTDHFVTAPLVVGDRVVVGTGDRQLVALDLATGHPLWNVRTRAAHLSDWLVQAGDILCYREGDNTLRALRAADGVHVWKLTTPLPLDRPAVDGHHLLVPTGPRLLRVDARTGEATTAVEAAEGEVLHTPVRVGTTVFAGFSRPDRRRLYAGTQQNMPGGVYSFDLEVPSVLWRTELPYHVLRAPRIVRGRVLVAESNGLLGSFHALDADTGEVLWSAPGAQTDLTSAGGLVWHGVLDHGWNRGQLRGLSVGSGQLRQHSEFSFELPQSLIEKRVLPDVSDPASSGGRIVFGCLDVLRCADARDGHVLWSWLASGRIEFAPIALEDVVVFATSAGYLYALQAP